MGRGSYCSPYESMELYVRAFGCFQYLNGVSGHCFTDRSRGTRDGKQRAVDKVANATHRNPFSFAQRDILHKRVIQLP
jgi:hypothetical protein